MMDFAYELIYVQEIFVYLRFSWSGEQVFFVDLTISTTGRTYFSSSLD